MIIPVYIDGAKCTAEISRRDWRRALRSMVRHYNKPNKWHFFRITNIKGCPLYAAWEYKYILSSQIDWVSLTL